VLACEVAEGGIEQGVQRAMTDLWQRGRAAWPALPLAQDRFFRFLSTRLTETPAEQWPRLCAEDLYLACACVDHLPGAAEAFTATYASDLASFIARRGSDSGQVSELIQDLLVRLIVGEPPEGPKLAMYGGRGSLRAWLRVMAVRKTLNAKRASTRHAELETRLIVDMAADPKAPEIAIMQSRHAEDFRVALRESLAALAAEPQRLLRMHYGQGLNLTAIGAAHGWSKSTTSRRLADARQGLLDGIRVRLQERLRVTPAELDSLIIVMRSQLVGSLARALEQEQPR
jgi:RNA polymerase sigma-70 factor, ECF subfamily